VHRRDEEKSRFWSQREGEREREKGDMRLFQDGGWKTGGKGSGAEDWDSARMVLQGWEGRHMR